MSPQETAPINVAQFGCGYWGPTLLRNFTAIPDFSLKWVADPSPQRRQYVQAHFAGVRVAASWEAVLAAQDVDAVAIATPASTHFELAAAALNAGKHVFVEKPMAMSAREVDALAAFARHGRRVLMAGHTFLYSPAIRRVESLISAGELGDVYFIYTQRLNLGQVRSDVNAWWNLAPHDVSILIHLRGGRLPVQITARGLSLIQPGIEDIVFAVLTWSDGVSAHVHVSWLDPSRVRRVTVIGSRKMVVWDDTADHKLTVLDKGVDRVPRIGERMDYDERLPTEFELRLRSGDVWLPRVDDGKEPLTIELLHFLDCIRTGETPLTGPAHARDVVAVLEAGERSLRAGGTPVAISAPPAAAELASRA